MTRYNHNPKSYAEAANKVYSLAAMCRELGILDVGSNYITVKKNIEKYGTDVSHFTGQAHNRGKFLTDSPKSKGSLKRKLIEDRGFGCEECGLTEHRGIAIVLELEHIDGNNKNNAYENLKLLCLLCHSQTPTWRRSKGSLEVNPKKVCPKCSGVKTASANLCNKCSMKTRKGDLKYRGDKEVEPMLRTKECSCGKTIDYRSAGCRSCANKKSIKGEYPPISELIEMLSKKSYTAVAKEIGISDNAIRKYITRRGYNPKLLGRAAYQKKIATNFSS